MILAGLPSAFAWRLAKLIAPIANEQLNYWAVCSPRWGYIGTHQWQGDRCATCKARRP